MVVVEVSGHRSPKGVLRRRRFAVLCVVRDSKQNGSGKFREPKREFGKDLLQSGQRIAISSRLHIIHQEGGSRGVTHRLLGDSFRVVSESDRAQ